MYYLYILQSSKDNKLYIGITGNVKKRLSEHNSGKVKSTKNRTPFTIAYIKKFPTRQAAAKEEWLIKHTPGVGKRKKELIKEYQQIVRA